MITHVVVIGLAVCLLAGGSLLLGLLRSAKASSEVTEEQADAQVQNDTLTNPQKNQKRLTLLQPVFQYSDPSGIVRLSGF